MPGRNRVVGLRARGVPSTRASRINLKGNPADTARVTLLPTTSTRRRTRIRLSRAVLLAGSILMVADAYGEHQWVHVADSQNIRAYFDLGSLVEDDRDQKTAWV